MIKLPAKWNNNEWYPFSDIDNFHKSIDRLFDFSFPGFGQTGRELSAGGWLPAIDIVDEKDRLILKAELPGLKKEDVEISILDDVLVIKGEKKSESQDKKENYVRCERTFGSFQRQIRLSSEIDQTKAEAAFKDGVLELTLPKKEGGQSKKISIDIK